MIEDLKLKIVEQFYTLQGEGGRAGQASYFIRLATCNKNCWFCDTEFNIYKQLRLGDILEKIQSTPARWITWTGGEPTLQLTEEIIAFFKSKGFLQSIETNGTNPVPAGIDYIVCSPKVPLPVLKKSFPNGVQEFRFPVDIKQKSLIPIDQLPPADHYFVSPLFLGDEKKRFDLDPQNLQHCIDLVMKNPAWKLSIQQHKIWRLR